MSTGRTGLAWPCVARSIASPTSSTVTEAAGTKITMRASTASSASRCGRTCSYRSDEAEPSMSIGFAVLASCGSTAARAARVSSDSCGSSSPAASHASAQRIPRPPALVRTTTRLPWRGGRLEKSAATSMSSSRVPHRVTPAWWKSAETAASEPARAAVWDEAAREPAPVTPLFIARIGLVRATRRAMRPKRLGFPNDSR